MVKESAKYYALFVNQYFPDLSSAKCKVIDKAGLLSIKYNG